MDTPIYTPTSIRVCMFDNVYETVEGHRIEHPDIPDYCNWVVHPSLTYHQATQQYLPNLHQYDISEASCGLMLPVTRAPDKDTAFKNALLVVKTISKTAYQKACQVGKKRRGAA